MYFKSILAIFGIFLLGEYLLPTDGIAFLSVVICISVTQISYFLSLSAQQDFGECILVVVLAAGCIESAFEMLWYFSKDIWTIPMWIIPFLFLTLFVAYRTDRILSRTGTQSE